VSSSKRILRARFTSNFFISALALSVAFSLVDCGGESSKSTGNEAGSGNQAGTAGVSGGEGQNGGASAVGGQGGASAGQGGSTEGGRSAFSYAGQAATLVTISPRWDWNGIIGTGQSLSVGTTPAISTTQPYNNLKLSLGDATVPPWDSSLSALSMVPLIEPIRKMAPTYPSPYPLNTWGETPHSAMANQLTTLVRYNSSSDYVSVHTVVGESGQGMVALAKSTGDTTASIGRAYAATIFEAEAITRLAKAEGKTYGIAAVLMTHGETDSGSSTYKDELIKLFADYNTDLRAITGQTESIPMFLSQQFAYPQGAGQRPLATQTQWQLGVERPTEFVCVGPKYQFPGKGDGVHLNVEGYRQYGEKVAQVYYERIVLGRDWAPLQPTAATRDGRKVIVTFHVPVPPLVWEESFSDSSRWPTGKGFELRQINSIVPIESVEISGNTVVITAGKDLPATNLTVGYAMTANSAQMTTASKSFRWGKLRDSDPFVGYVTSAHLPNYAVSFDYPVP
jgi:lysophospholipase L1-like esterase